MRYVCIHGHYYQPPRIDPATGVMRHEPSAAPFHDWNERITDECYRPNAAAKILDPVSGEVEALVNTYAWTSFDFGPTLLAWLEHEAPDVYQAVLDADRLSIERWGHGNAIAQGYHHTILPLANPRDRETEVRWGIADFIARFGRSPAGMWLPECAVDTPTLETLAAEGIEFTLLAPRQARAVKAPDHEWMDVGEDDLDTRRPYRVDLPSGRSIVVFFYDGGASQRVAFERVLDDGVRFAEALAHGIGSPAYEAHLSHIATDGESYGHHHRFGEMALAYAIRELEQHDDLELTNYPAFLARHPVTWQARIREPSSWSCVHGVERWRSDCSCALGPSEPGDQGWRTPLRDALDWLRDEIHGFFQETVRARIADPWALRDAYHLARSKGPEAVDALLDERALEALTPRARVELTDTLEMERLTLTMFTSCGWFFDDPSDIGTQQDIKAAAEAARRYEALSGRRVRAELARRLEGVQGAAVLVEG